MFVHFDKIAPKNLVSRRCLLCGCEFRPRKSIESFCNDCNSADEACHGCKAREEFCSECREREEFLKLAGFSSALAVQPIVKFV